VELPEVFDRQRDSLLVRKAPEDVGGNRAAEMGVQLGEAFHQMQNTRMVPELHSTTGYRVSSSA
ncbi:MAG: hypothetical protein QOI71_1833, partial [Gaiellales bacterium]|nr:hypothetical protein [Gaiellales bacterium]